MAQDSGTGMGRRLVILGVVALAVVGAFVLRGGSADAPDGGAASKDAPLPVLLDLGADKCIPCKMMIPVLDELEQGLAGQLEVRFIDVWKFPEQAKPYGIKLIPTQIFLAPDGSELFRHEGFFARDDILAKWRELGFEFSLPAQGKG